MEREMNIFEIARAILKRYKILLILILIFGFLGSGLSFLSNDKQHESTIPLIVGTETQEETDELNQITGEPIYEEVIEYGNSSIPDQSKKFYSETLARQDLLKEVIDNLNLEIEASELRDNISMEVPENSSSIFLTVTSSKLKQVDIVAEEVAEVFMDKVYEITDIEKIQVLNNASDPIIKNSVNIAKNTIIATLIGIGVAFVVILILEYLDDSVQKSADIEDVLNIRILGELKNKNTLKEDIKMVRTNLEHSKKIQDKKVISLTTVSSNINISVDLSEALKKTKKEVLLIDANFRKPELDKILGIPNDYGLSNLLNKDIKIGKALKSTDIGTVLTAGNYLENAPEKLASFEMQELLKKLKTHYDYIIINGHRINVFTDTLELSTLTDGVIILVEQNKTSLKELKKIKRKLDDVGTSIIGVIFKKYNQ